MMIATDQNTSTAKMLQDNVDDSSAVGPPVLAKTKSFGSGSSIYGSSRGKALDKDEAAF